MNPPPQTAESRTSLLPIIIGFLLFGGLLLGLGLWVSRREPATPTIPTVTLLSPASDTITSDSIVVVFRTAPTIRLQPTGWGAGRFHLHALLDSIELMPAAADIHRVADGRWSWTLPPVRRPSTLRLVWAGPDHRRLPDAASATVTVSPRP